MSKIIVITPTADQPTGVFLAERYMQRQTIQPDRWIVADDGDTHATLTMGQEHIKRPRTAKGGASLGGNLLAALDACIGSDAVIVIWEHDDWYAPNHIETCIDRIGNRCLATGSIWQRYYNVEHRLWRKMRNIGSALCNTAFDARLIGYLQRACEDAIEHNHYGIDRRFWESLPRGMADLHNKNTVVGIKGLPGRPGLGMGHRPKGCQWESDPDGSLLHSWLGPDARAYLDG